MVILGTFISPCAGVYLITFSYEGGDATEVFLHKNGAKLSGETEREIVSSPGSFGFSASVEWSRQYISSVGGRWASPVYQRLKAGDILTLKSHKLRGSSKMNNIIMCVEFLNN